MQCLLIVFCSLALFCRPGVVPAAEPASAATPLSPYFFVEGDDSGLDRFPLKDTKVEVNISGVIAEVTVTQTYANMGDSPIHGRYIFPGSTRAAVHGMKMTIGERVIKAVVQEKGQAEITFNTAKKEGKNAALLKQQRPNVFSMETANIMPGDTIEIELRYTEILVPENNIYSFVYPTVVGPRYAAVPDSTENTDEHWVHNPYLQEGSEARTDFDIAVNLAAGMKVESLRCPSHETLINYRSASSARITLRDPKVFGGDRDYILKYRLAGRAVSSGLLIERGEKENFFLLMAQPPERVQPEQIPPREYSFIIDVSGSMNGFPLNTAKVLLTELIAGLKPTDSFNLHLFAGGSRSMSRVPVPATGAHIRRAVDMIDNSSGGGGTELLKAMKRAMGFKRTEGVSRTMVIITDGYVNTEKRVFSEIRKHLNNTNVFAFGIGSSVNRYLIEGIAESGKGEPFVVTSPSEAPAAVRKFREYISSPVLTDIRIKADGVDIYDVEPLAVPDLFGERPIMVYGKWRGERSGSIEVSGKSGEGGYSKVFALDEAQPLTSRGIGYLWARSRLQRISDYGPGKDDPQTQQDIVALGLAYNLLTPYTSFVAVDETIRNPGGNGEDLPQPLPLPKGVSNLAVGGTMKKVPEPELVVPAVLLLITLVLGSRRRRSQRSRG